MFKFIKNLFVACISWFFVTLAVGFGTEAGKDAYKKFKAKHAKESKEN